MPTPLRRYVDGETSVAVPAGTLRELVHNLDERYPGIRAHLLNPEDDDRLALGLAAIVDGEPTNMGLLTRLEADAEVHFLAAIAGGGPDPFA